MTTPPPSDLASALALPTTKVMQRGSDDCMRACLATYFGVPIESVPLTNGDNWMDAVRDFCTGIGFGFMSADVTPGAFERFGRGLLIVAGKSPRGLRHAVIYLDGKLWHDPHPEGGGILSVEHVDLFYPLRTIAAAARKTLAPVEPKELALEHDELYHKVIRASVKRGYAITAKDEAAQLAAENEMEAALRVLCAAARRCQEAEQRWRSVSDKLVDSWAERDRLVKSLEAADKERDIAKESAAEWEHARDLVARDRDAARAEIARVSKCQGCGGDIGAHFSPDQGGCPGDFRIDGVRVAPLNHAVTLLGVIERKTKQVDEALRQRDDFADGIAAVLIAAGASTDRSEMEQQVKAAGAKPSDFVKQRFQGMEKKCETLEDLLCIQESRVAGLEDHESLLMREIDTARAERDLAVREREQLHSAYVRAVDDHEASIQRAALALEAVKRDVTLSFREKFSNPNLPAIYCDNNGMGYRISYDEMHAYLADRIKQAKAGAWFWPEPPTPPPPDEPARGPAGLAKTTQPPSSPEVATRPAPGSIPGSGDSSATDAAVLTEEAVREWELFVKTHAAAPSHGFAGYALPPHEFEEALRLLRAGLAAKQEAEAMRAFRSPPPASAELVAAALAITSGASVSRRKQQGPDYVRVETNADAWENFMRVLAAEKAKGARGGQ